MSDRISNRISNQCIATQDTLSFPNTNHTKTYHTHHDKQCGASSQEDTPTARGLNNMGATELFPIQRAVIPSVQVLQKAAMAGDICVSAPTGSGKTLSYVIPVVEALKHRVICQINALILVPSRQLAQQVGNVVHDFTRYTSLKYIVLGMDSYHHEMRQMQNDDRVAVDIVVATPGRLLQHMVHTKGFSLDRLRFLIVDEVDRLLAGQYHDWINVVISGKAQNPAQQARSNIRIKYGSTRDATPLPTPSYKSPLRKMLFSATMTNNPEQLAKLNLRFPQFFSFRDELSSNKRYVLPSSLRQHVLLCHTEHKPLAVIYLLEQKKIKQSLCFTSNLSATHRLYRMLELFGDYRVAEYSSHMSHQERSSVVHEFSAGKLDLVVCSDVMARGMDLPDVRNVINYDLPSLLTTYIHRAGRTARAGAEGHVYTIIDEEEETLAKRSDRQRLNNNEKCDKNLDNNSNSDEDDDEDDDALLNQATGASNEEAFYSLLSNASFDRSLLDSFVLPLDSVRHKLPQLRHVIKALSQVLLREEHGLQSPTEPAVFDALPVTLGEHADDEDGDGNNESILRDALRAQIMSNINNLEPKLKRRRIS